MAVVTARGGAMGLSLLCLFVACGKASRKGNSELGGGGEGGGAAVAPGSAAGATAVPQGGAAGEVEGGAGGDEQTLAGMAGMAGAGGLAELPDPPDDLFDVLVPPEAPSEIVTGTGPARKRVPVEPSDEVTSYPGIIWINHDGSVIAASWEYSFYRPRTTGTYEPQIQALRWTAQGFEQLVDEPDTVRSVPLGMNSDGSVVFVLFETFSGKQSVCRWTAEGGCQVLGHPGVTGRLYDCQPWHRQSACVSRNGQYLLIDAETDVPYGTTVRWSAENDWETRLGASGNGIDDTGAVLLSNEEGPAIWPLSAPVAALSVPAGFESCTLAWNESGSLRVGSCWNPQTDAHQAFDWTTPQTPEPWGGAFGVGSINPDATAVAGQMAVPAQGGQSVAVRWTAADGLETILTPAEAEQSVSTVQLSDDGQVVFGDIYDPTSDLRQWFRWSKLEGPSLLLSPASADRMEVAVANQDGSVLGGQSYFDADLSKAYATRWDEAGPRVIGSEVEVLGFDLQAFHPERVLYVGVGAPLLMIGTGRLPLLGTGPIANRASSIWIAHLPGL